MSDHSLQPLCALLGTAPARHTIGTITIAENPGLAMASLAGRDGRSGDARKALKKIAKLDLPGPGCHAKAGDWAAFWTSADQWMVSAPIASHEDIAGIVKAAVGDAASVTEQTDGWVRFEITGERCRALFELLCNVDIQRMDAGQATRTQIEHLGTFVLCQTPGTAYSLLTLRSAAASLQHALEAAATAIR